ncbi:MAG TPA: branched-chain amino acid ABC transporter permease [Acidimicrobiia bacterium]|nr:branched-chain amino acid ABC transporter permease [Acidimicrobiia bacterium]
MNGHRQRPGPAGWAARGALLAALAGLVLVVPAGRGNVEVHVFTQAAIYAVIGLSLNILLGYTGQISLGHQAFVGIGAFTAAYMVSRAGQPFLAGIVMAMVVGGLQALVLGVVSLRVTGLYFALVTLAYGTMAEESLFNIQSLTGGSAGQPAPKPAGFSTDLRYYYLCLAFLAAVIWVDWRLMRTKGGRALLAVRENPKVAATNGVDVKVYTLMAFVVAGVFAGLGGALLAHNDTFVVRDLFDFQLALVFVIMTVVGGLRNRTGVVLGSAFFSLVGYFFDKLFSGGLHVPGLKVLPKEYVPIVIGPVLLLYTLTRHPGGVGQQIRPLQRWLRGGRFSFKDTHERDVRVTDARA